jgi:ABC-2 type transport system permease protein
MTAAPLPPTPSPARAPGRPRSTAASAHVLARVTRNEGRLFLREPSAAFFGLAFPAVLLVVLGLFMPWADQPFDDRDPVLSQITAITGYTPIVLALAIATVAFSTFPVPIATYRGNGVLRRLATTPLPSSRVLAAQVLVNVATLVVAAVLAVVLGVVVLDISLPADPLVLVLGFVLGATSSMAVGCLIAARAPNTSAANGVGMLLYFVSLFFAGVWMPLPLMPEVVQTISQYTPVGAASQAMGAGWYGQAFPATELLVMAAWTLVGVPLAAKLFRWS